MDDAAGVERRPAFYAARPGGWRDWWTLLHPPYTAWHLAYVVIGASLAPRVELSRLLATLLAFFFAVGLAAHALDELHGRPLGTRIPTPVLIAVTVAGLAGAIILGIAGALPGRVAPDPVHRARAPARRGVQLGALRRRRSIPISGSPLAWGSFPVLVAYVAQTGRLAARPGHRRRRGFALSAAQRRLSTPARMIRRRAVTSRVRSRWATARCSRSTRATLLAPLETALHAMSWGVVLLAAALAVARLH